MWRARAVLGLLGAVCAGGAAQAGFNINCAAYDPCSSDTPPDGPFDININYELPNHGLAIGEKWTFWIDNGDPNALVSLSPPNEAFTDLTYRLADGTLDVEFSPFRGAYRFKEIRAHGAKASYLVAGPRDDDNCADTSIIGLCAVTNHIWGNDVFVIVSTDRPFELRSAFQDNVGVPEPEAWALLVLGFAGVGCLARRRGPLAAIGGA